MSRDTSTNTKTVLPVKSLAIAIFSGLMTSSVNADTLAQPADTSLERTASHYIQFREDVSKIEGTPFKNADSTREAHRLLGTHDSKYISSGWVAYAALVAADSPAFAKALKKELKKSKQRGLTSQQAFLSKLGQNPRLPRELSGVDDAIAAVLNMTVSDSARISALGEEFKTQAYAMQKTKWGKKRISAGPTRVNDAEAYGRSRSMPSTPDLYVQEDSGVVTPSLASSSENWDASWGASASGGLSSERNADVILDRILNLAARYSVGALNEKVVAVYARNDRSEQCLSMAKLTLDQCIAATRSPYEEAFCIGEHALNDTATCTSWVAN